MSRLFTRLQSLLLLACAGLFFFPLASRALWDSDEGRYAEIAREMLATHQWLIPHLNGVVYFEKPPLAYWFTAIGMTLFGDNTFGARFFAALFGLLTVTLVFRIGRYWQNERTGLLAGLVLATSTAFFILTQYLVVDMILTFWLTLTLDASIHLQQEDRPAYIRKYAFLLAVGMAGAFLTKGLIAIVLPGSVFAVSVMLQRSFPQARKIPWLDALLLFLLLSAPWVLWVSAHFHYFPYFFFIHEHFARYLTQVHQRTGPFYYFVPVVLIGFLPWIFFVPQLLWDWFEKRGEAFRNDETALLLLVWIGFIFVFFSFSGSKLPAYILPIFPALALLVGHFFEGHVDAIVVSRRILWGVDGLMVFFLGLLFLLRWIPTPSFLQQPLVSILIEQASLLALTLALCVLILVGVWGMRNAIAAFGGVLITQVLFLSSLTALAPVLDPWLSTERLAQIVATRAAPEDQVAVYGLSYETYAQSLAFYTKRRIAVFGPPGELALGASHAVDAAAWFAEGDLADRAVKQLPIGSWVVTNEEYWARIRALGIQEEFAIIEKSGRLFLVQKTE